MTTKEKEGIKEIRARMYASLERDFIRTHEVIMAPAPEKFKGLACRYRDVKEKENASRV